VCVKPKEEGEVLSSFWLKEANGLKGFKEFKEFKAVNKKNKIKKIITMRKTYEAINIKVFSMPAGTQQIVFDQGDRFRNAQFTTSDTAIQKAIEKSGLFGQYVRVIREEAEVEKPVAATTEETKGSKEINDLNDSNELNEIKEEEPKAPKPKATAKK